MIDRKGTYVGIMVIAIVASLVGCEGKDKKNQALKRTLGSCRLTLYIVL